MLDKWMILIDPSYKYEHCTIIKIEDRILYFQDQHNAKHITNKPFIAHREE